MEEVLFFACLDDGMMLQRVPHSSLQPLWAEGQKMFMDNYIYVFCGLSLLLLVGGWWIRVNIFIEWSEQMFFCIGSRNETTNVHGASRESTAIISLGR